MEAETSRPALSHTSATWPTSLHFLHTPTQANHLSVSIYSPILNSTYKLEIISLICFFIMLFNTCRKISLFHLFLGSSVCKACEGVSSLRPSSVPPFTLGPVSPPPSYWWCRWALNSQSSKCSSFAFVLDFFFLSPVGIHFSSQNDIRVFIGITLAP